MKIQLLNKAINPAGDTIGTFLLHDFPKSFLSEIGRHRLFSFSWESSRARPFKSVLTQIENDPYIPPWTLNQPGMSGIDLTDTLLKDEATRQWLELRDEVIRRTQIMSDTLNIHKQDINRALEPWLRVSGLVTATDFTNFFQLRTKPDVQPAFREFATAMEELFNSVEPITLNWGEWYKPWQNEPVVTNTSKAAATSYAAHQKDKPFEKHLELFDDLSRKKHFSPFEHSALAVHPGFQIEDHYVFDHFKPIQSVSKLCLVRSLKTIGTGNFTGFLQLRKILEIFPDVEPYLANMNQLTLEQIQEFLQNYFWGKTNKFTILKGDDCWVCVIGEKHSEFKTLSALAALIEDL